MLEEAKELPKSIIRSVIIETPEEEQQLRLFLTGAVKVDERGCHTLGCNMGLNVSIQNPDVSNGTDLKFDYSLDEKLRIIDVLTAVIQRNETVAYPHAEEAEKKLLALIQSI
ncbi:MAG: hypothetical protein Q4F77_00340 [Acinetobacter sp.]|uniref:hypothetical protein n=1 Tax=Acinetobacter sp. TaxID=472 RepID=UPI0026E03B5D|nr:hypothetical protein [Acinetobacter sp.]MDO5541731.1 hypothetical protein [Acinetobacter sp.]